MLQRRKRNDKDCYFISWKNARPCSADERWQHYFQETKTRRQRPGPPTLFHPLGHFCPGERYFTIFPQYFSIFLKYDFFFELGLSFSGWEIASQFCFGRSQSMVWMIPPLQVAIMFISLLLYGFGPIGVDLYKRSSMVSRQDELDDQMAMLNLLRC